MKTEEKKKRTLPFFNLHKNQKAEKVCSPFSANSLFPLHLVSFLSSQSFACLVAGHSKNTCLFCFVADIAFLA